MRYGASSIKKLAISILIAMILFSGQTAAAANLTTASTWAVSELRSLSRRNMIPEELFQAYQSGITRAEFTALMVAYVTCAQGNAEAAQTTFTDISDCKYAQDIEKAYTLGIINGRSATIFDPNGMLTRQEAAKIVYFSVSKAVGISNKQKEELSFDDADQIAAWALPYVKCVAQLGIMTGTGRTFSPDEQLSREQALAMTERQINKVFPVVKPVCRALVVGISDYCNDRDAYESRFTNAADELAEVFNKNGFDQVTKAESLNPEGLKQVIQTTFASATEAGLSVFSFSGHGKYVSETGTYDFVISDGKKDYNIGYDELLNAFNEVPGKKLIIIGACFSGQILDYVTKDENMYILTSSTADEESYAINRGTDAYNEFEHAVAQGLGLSGSLLADKNGDFSVDFQELRSYVSSQVKYSTVSGCEPGSDLSIVLSD